MAAPASLDQLCSAFAAEVSSRVPDALVLVGTPSAAAAVPADHHHYLNLFFFRFETSGFDAGVGPGEPWLLRVHCLITPFGTDEDGVLAGQKDLRLLDDVLRMCHEAPVSELGIGGSSFLIQKIFLNLGLEQINQLWSTQGDVPYRPSVLLELSLVPIFPEVPASLPSLVGQIDLRVRGEMQPAAELRTPAPGQPVGVLEPSTATELWAPALCLVVGNDCLQSVSVARNAAGLQPFLPATRVWVAGETGEEVTLRWEVWDRQSGWSPLPGGKKITITNRRIDPRALASANLSSTELPLADRAGQALLYAERQVLRASDGHPVVVRSNPVLVTLFEQGT